MKKTYVSFNFFFLIFEQTFCAVSFDYSEIVAIVKMRAVIEKETALNMNEIAPVIIRSGFR